jgi:hypothetical protein
MKCDKALAAARWLCIVRLFASLPMKDFLAFTVLSGMFVTLAWSYAAQPLPPDNAQVYEQCTQLHPQRFCAINYFPSKLKAMEGN